MMEFLFGGEVLFLLIIGAILVVWAARQEAETQRRKPRRASKEYTNPPLKIQVSGDRR